MPELTLQLLSETLSIHRFSNDFIIPEKVLLAPLYFIAKTSDETSIVLPQSFEILSDNVEADWRALKVQGPLDFSLTGILAKIAHILAEQNISIFAISTFDTDYILLKQPSLSAGIAALRQNQYLVLT